MSKYLRYAGIAASAVLIVFGVASMIIGTNGRSTVRDNLAAEKIVGSDDMTPTAIAAAAKEAGLKNIVVPSCSVAGKAVDNGANARCFAQYMRIHALEASGGNTYAQMGRKDDARRLIRIELEESPGQRLGTLRIHGVASLGTVVNHSPDGSVLFDLDSHVSTLSPS